MQEDFNKYMLSFKSRSLKDKQNIVIEQLKMLAILTNSMCKELNVDNEILLNRELIDINKDNYTEDDFAEALIVYINSIQNSLCDYCNKLVSVNDNF